MDATALCGSARQQGPEVEIILQRFQLTPAVSLLVGGLPLSPAEQSHVAANTTTQRQEVDESWTDFNLHLTISLRGWLTGKIAAASHGPISSVFEQIGYRFASRKRVIQDV